jgi:hypothetical protein
VKPLNVPAEHGKQTEEPAARILVLIIAAVIIHLHHPHAAQTVTVASAEVHAHADVFVPSFIHKPVELM